LRDYFWGSTTEGPEEEDGMTPHDYASESKGHASEDHNIVDFSHNRIYFYSGVTRPKILKLNKGIFNMNISMLSKTGPLEYAPPPIKLHINSYGGSVFAGLSAVDYIKNSKVPVHTVIDGCAASAATLMSCVGERRFMHKNACMLVHQLSGLMWGKFQEMQDDMKNSEMLMKKIKDIYREHTKIPKREMDNLLKHDIWWEAEKCLEYGLVDELI
jgi:ATP-dependent protease ClpP protease subunit|tara:strand:- start:1877 stop:2518 length:642 start_codon:yes stop_codon:yes gene_type:complete